MTTKKKLTFRQRLRVDAIGDLTTLVDQMTDAAKKVCKDKGIDPIDLMKLASNRIAKTLCAELVTKLANAKERELEKLYNKQMDLIPEEKKDGNK